MNIEELSKNSAKLEKISCLQDNNKITDIIFYFENDIKLILTTNPETDELIWKNESINEDNSIGLHFIYPCIKNTYGLYLTWSWEMSNQQGYLDAMQLELTSKNLSYSIIFQFKVASSFFQIFQVNPV